MEIRRLTLSPSPSLCLTLSLSLALRLAPDSSQLFFHPSSPAFSPSLTCHRSRNLPCEKTARIIYIYISLSIYLYLLCPKEARLANCSRNLVSFQSIDLIQARQELCLYIKCRKLLSHGPAHHFRGFPTAFLHASHSRRSEYTGYAALVDWPHLQQHPSFRTSCAMRRPAAPLPLAANSKPLKLWVAVRKVK